MSESHSSERQNQNNNSQPQGNNNRTTFDFIRNLTNLPQGAVPRGSFPAVLTGISLGFAPRDTLFVARNAFPRESQTILGEGLQHSPTSQAMATSMMNDLSQMVYNRSAKSINYGGLVTPPSKTVSAQMDRLGRTIMSLLQEKEANPDATQDPKEGGEKAEKKQKTRCGEVVSLQNGRSLLGFTYSLIQSGFHEEGISSAVHQVLRRKQDFCEQDSLNVELVKDTILDTVMHQCRSAFSGESALVPASGEEMSDANVEAEWDTITQKIKLYLYTKEDILGPENSRSVYKRGALVDVSLEERRKLFLQLVAINFPRSDDERVLNIITGFNRLEFDPSQPIDSAVQQVSRMPAEQLRHALNIHFAGQEGVDYGGVTKGFLANLASAVNEGLLPYLQVSESDGLMYPGVEAVGEVGGAEFFFTIGRIVGFTLINSDRGATFPVRLSPLFFKLLLGQPLVVSDLAHIDTDMTRNLKRLLKYKDLIEDMELSFSVSRLIPDQNGHTLLELVPGGSNRGVTRDNVDQYIITYIEWRLLNGVKNLLKAFVKGVNDVMPLPYLQAFKCSELQTLVCGERTVDVESLLQSAVLRGFDPQRKDHRDTLDWFAQSLRSLSNEELSDFLRFFSGSPFLPAGGAKSLSPPFTLHFIGRRQENGFLSALPTTITPPPSSSTTSPPSSTTPPPSSSTTAPSSSSTPPPSSTIPPPSTSTPGNGLNPRGAQSTEVITADHLPTASTCSNELHLPVTYSSQRHLLEKLRQALPATGFLLQ